MQNLGKRFGLFSSKRTKHPMERKMTKSTGSLEEIKTMRRKTSSASDQRKSEFFVSSPIATWPTCNLAFATMNNHVTSIVSTHVSRVRCVTFLRIWQNHTYLVFRPSFITCCWRVLLATCICAAPANECSEFAVVGLLPSEKKVFKTQSATPEWLYV